MVTVTGYGPIELCKIFTNLMTYANANGISVTESDAENIAAKMEKG